MKYIFLAIIVFVFGGLLFKAIGAEGTNKVHNIVLTPANHTAFRGAVDDASVDKVLSAITKSDPSKVFYLYIESPGGSVFAGRRLVTYLTSTDRNIVCVANTAISMGFVILQACPVRLVTNQSILMTHQIASRAEGSLRDLQAAVSMTEKLAFLYDSFMANRMGLTLEAYRAKLNPEFWMMGASEALTNRAADNEVIAKCSSELEKATEKIGDIVISRCPIT